MFIFLTIAGGFGTYYLVTKKKNDAKIAQIKEGWYVEVLEDSVKIRKDPDRNSALLKETKKGEVYKVDEMAGKSNYWYHIEYEDGKYGWIANPKNTKYLLDTNNPEDIANPTIKFSEAVYYANSINEINYDHLEISDDKPGVKVEHKVYHEINEEMGKNQYWIQYIATDKVGKVAKKVQKIEFNTLPDESEVLDFNTLER